MCSKSEDHCLGKTPKYVKLIIFGGGVYATDVYVEGETPLFWKNPPCAFQGKNGLDAARFFSDKKLKDSQAGDIIHWYFVSERD